MSDVRVAVVGDAGLDVVARHDRPLAHGGDTRAGVTLAGGGAGANTALWLRTAGAEVRLIGRVGDDAGGRLVRAELEAAGITCAFAVDPGAPTCCVVVLVDAEGQRTMLPDRGASARLSPGDVDTGALAGAAHLHLSGYVLLDPSSRPAGLAALATARAAGLTTSVDPQSAALLADPGAFLADVEGVDLLLPNAAELAALTGSASVSSACDLLDVVGAVVVTWGSDGAAWIDGDGTTSVPAETAGGAGTVDTTGAGDAFDAGLLTAWLSGKSTVDSLCAGHALGVRAVGQTGAQPAPVSR